MQGEATVPLAPRFGPSGRFGLRLGLGPAPSFGLGLGLRATSSLGFRAATSLGPRSRVALRMDPVVRTLSPAKGWIPRSPGKESRYRRTLIALTKKKKRKEQETEMSKKHRGGCRQSYLRGGRLKVHFGGSMKLPRHGSV